MPVGSQEGDYAQLDVVKKNMSCIKWIERKEYNGEVEYPGVWAVIGFIEEIKAGNRHLLNISTKLS